MQMKQKDPSMCPGDNFLFFKHSTGFTTVSIAAEFASAFSMALSLLLQCEAFTMRWGSTINCRSSLFGWLWYRAPLMCFLSCEEGYPVR